MTRALVLVVENDPMSRELCRRVLTAGGFRVACASSGEEALEIAPRLRPALVLMDVGLPGMDGIAALRRLRARPATASVPVAMLSAGTQSDDAERARRAGCVDYLPKPMRASDLLDRVRALVERHRARARSLPKRGGNTR